MNTEEVEAGEVGAGEVSAGLQAALATLRDELLIEFGRGGLEIKRSLSRAFIELGETVEAPLRELTSHPGVHIRAHAVATLQLYADPESSFTIS